MIEILLAALADAILSLLIEDLAQRPGLAALREKVRGDSSQKLALQRALAGAYTAFKRKHPQIADAFFDEPYLKKPEVVAELAKLLRPNQHPDVQALQNSWQTQFHQDIDIDLNQPIQFFMDTLSSEIKAQPLLKPFVDSRALEQLVEQVTEQTGQNEAQNRLLTEIRDLLADKRTETSPSKTYSVTATFATIPDLIPEQPEKLIGRETLQTQVEDLLNGGKRVLLLQGFGGMGKTALAATIAARWVATKGPVLWVKAGTNEADAIFEGLARPFNAQQTIASAQGEAKSDVLRQILSASGATLLVIDDAWEGDALAPILNGIPNKLPVLLTSRIRHPIGEIIPVGELDPPDALALLELHAGASYIDDDSATTLCQTLGYHAYAIEIAGKTLKVDQLTPAELLHKIENAPHNLNVPNELALEGRRAVADLIEVSLNALKDKDEIAYRVFLAFGAFFTPSATPELIRLYMSSLAETQHVAPLQKYTVDSALTTLARRGLAEKVQDAGNAIAHYRIHELAYAYARAQSDDDNRDRAVAACLNYTQHYNSPGPENFAALRPEIDNFMGAAAWAFFNERYTEVERFAWTLYGGGSELFVYQGYYREAVILLERAAQAAAAQGNRQNEGAHLGNLGIAYASLGRYQQAIDYHQRALAITRENNDRSGESYLLGNLGVAYAELGQYQQAIKDFLLVLVVAREIGDRYSEGNALDNLGSAYASLGQYPTAIDYHQQALAIAREIGDRRGKGNALNNLGIAYASLGQYPTAIDYHQQALAIAREIGDRHGEGSRLGSLGIAYFNLGQYPPTIDYHQQGLAIAREIGDRRGEGSHLGNLGIAYASLGQYPQAIDYFQQALVIAREIGDRRGEGNWLGSLGLAYSDLGQVQQAIDYHQQALAIVGEIGDRRGEGSHLGNLGVAYASLGQYQQAIDYFQQALEIAREIGNRHTEGNWLGNLGNTYYVMGQINQAIEFYQQALAISREIGDQRNEGNWLGSLGTANYRLQQYTRAIDHYQQARAIFEAIGVPHLVEQTDRNIAEARAALAGDAADTSPPTAD